MYKDIFPFIGKLKETSDTGRRNVDIRAMDRAARLIHQSLALIEPLVQPGTKTLFLAEEIDTFLVNNGADPGLIIRISPEDTVWHGIPDERRIQAGDLVSIDVACSVKGWWADAARTFGVGEIDNKRKNLLRSAWEGTKRVVSAMEDGNTGEESADTIADLCRRYKISLITEGAGHGIGRRLHETPSLTYDGRKHAPTRSGNLYTAEPIFSAGDGSILISLDGSAVTGDGEPSAHFEVTVVLVDHGAHILGAPEWINCSPC